MLPRQCKLLTINTSSHYYRSRSATNQFIKMNTFCLVEYSAPLRNLLYYIINIDGYNVISHRCVIGLSRLCLTMHIPYTFSWNIGVDFCPLIAVYLFAIFGVNCSVSSHVLIDFLKRNHKAFSAFIVSGFARRRLEIGEGGIRYSQQNTTQNKIQSFDGSKWIVLFWVFCPWGKWFTCAVQKQFIIVFAGCL